MYSFNYLKSHFPPNPSLLYWSDFFYIATLVRWMSKEVKNVNLGTCIGDILIVVPFMGKPGKASSMEVQGQWVVICTQDV